MMFTITKGWVVNNIIISENYDLFRESYNERYGDSLGFFRSEIDQEMKKYKKCGIPKHGFAIVRCLNDDCWVSLPFREQREYAQFSAALFILSPSRLVSFAEHATDGGGEEKVRAGSYSILRRQDGAVLPEEKRYRRILVESSG